MISAVTVLGFVVSELVLPLAVERLGGAGIQRVKGWLTGARDRPRPEHDGLERAARRAYLNATLSLTASCLRSFGKPVSASWRSPNRGYWATEADALYRLQRDLRDQVRALDDPGSAVPTLPGDRGDLWAARPGTVPGVAEAPELQRVLQACLLEEVRSFGLPREFEAALTGGWDELVPGERAVRVDWFSLVTSFFLDDVRHDPALSRALDDELALLADLSINVGELRSHLDAFAQTAVRLLEQLGSGLEALREGMDEISGKLDDLAPLGRDPAWVGQEVDRLVDGSRAQIFVGREVEFEQLRLFLAEHTSGYLVITAPAGHGKSALLARWLGELEERRCAVAYHFFSSTPAPGSSTPLTSVDEGYVNLRRQLRDHTGHRLPRSGRGRGFTELVDLVNAWPGDRPLVVVIDGLDEADSLLEVTFPTPLPPGVYVVVAGRATGHDNPEFLSAWTARDGRNRLCLGRLGRADLAAWLRVANAGGLAPLAEEPEFLDHLLAKTEGDPRYLHHLLEELAHATEDTARRRVLAQVPLGFSSYVKASIKRLLPLLDPEQRDAFVLLAVAKGPIREDEIGAVLGHAQAGSDRPVLVALDDDWRVRRWLAVTDGPDCAEWSFASRQEAEIFAQHLHGVARAARRNLAAWCGTWREHEPGWTYAIRHYPEHLLDQVPERAEGESEDLLPARETLYSLAGDLAFTRQQLTRLPAEPEAALRTIQAAIRAAARTDDAGAIVRFMLRHYHQLAELRQSPVQALRSGGPHRARTLANFAPPDDSVLWHLLITLALVEVDANQARVTLTQLANRDLRALRGWREVDAAVLLAELLGFDPVAEKLARRLLSDRARFAMVLHLLARVDRQPGVVQPAALVNALAVCWGFTQAAVRRLGLIEIAPALNRAGLIDEASAALQEAARTIEEADGPDLGDEVSLSEAWALVGDLEQAARWAERVKRPGDRLRALLTLARSAGETEAGVRDAALEQALLIARSRGVWWVWQEVATMWNKTLSIEPPPASERAGTPAEAAAGWIAAFVDREGVPGLPSVLAELHVGDPLTRVDYLVALVGAANGRGDRVTAVKAAAEAERAVEPITEPLVRVLALGKLAVARVVAGLASHQEAFEAAQSTLTRITEAGARCDALLWIEGALRSLDEFAAADRCIEEVVRLAAELPEAQERVGVLLRAAREVSAEWRSRLIDEALTIAGTIPEAEERFAWLMSVAATESGDEHGRDGLERSLQTADAIVDPGLRGSYLAAAALRQAHAGAHRRARRLAGRAVVAAAQQPPAEAATLLARIAVIQHLAHDPSATATLEHASTLVAGCTDEVVRGQLRAALVQSVLDMADPQAAVGLAGAIEHPEFRALSLWMVAGCLVRAGRVAQPVTVLDQALTACFAIKEPGNRAGAVVVVVDAYSAGAGYGADAALTNLGRVAGQLDRETEPAKDSADEIWRQLTQRSNLGFQAYEDGALDSAARLFYEAGELASTLPDQTQSLAMLAGLGYLAHLRELGESALSIFDLARRTAEDATPSVDQLLAQVRLAWAAELMGFGGPDQASGYESLIRRIELVEDPRARARLLPVVQHLGPVHDEQLAKLSGSTVDENEPPTREQVLTLLIIARSQLRAGLTTVAAQTFAAAAEVAASLTNEGDRSVLMAAVNEALHLPADTTDAAAGQLAAEEGLVYMARVADALAEAGDHQQAATVLLEARNNVPSCAPDRVADLTEALDQLAAEHGLASDPEGAPSGGGQDRPMPPVAGPAPVATDPEPMDRGQLIARTLAAGARQGVDVRWTLAQIELQSAPTSVDPTDPAADRLPEPVWSGAAELVSAGQAATTLPGGMDGVRRVMAVMQLSQDALVRTDQTQQAVLSLGGRQLLAAARQAVDAADRDGFEAYLIPSSYHPEIGAELLALVARVYPLQLASVLAELQRAQPIG